MKTSIIEWIVGIKYSKAEQYKGNLFGKVMEKSMGKQRITTKKLRYGITILPIVILAILLSYLAYLQIQYYRIADHTVLEIKHPSDQILQYNTDYRIMTYNIGFGAYGQDFSFFMDSSRQKETGKILKGKYGKGISYKNVLENTRQSVALATQNVCDFYFFQEVDIKSTRSYGLNQVDMLADGFSDYASVFASNFHSAYLAYPFHDMHGIVNSGILTFSKFRLESAIRRSFPVSDSFVDKFFDLDRCFSVQRLSLADEKELVLLNIHMSAYDKGGLIRKEQLKMLNEVLQEEYNKGNYVIAGGDFNHDYCNSTTAFLGDKEVPDWIATIQDTDLTPGYHFVIPQNKEECGTCRGSETPYDRENTSQFIVDGFIISDNITANATIVNADYIASDHNPVIMEFRLNLE